jgi:hypothetical protein
MNAPWANVEPRVKWMPQWAAWALAWGVLIGTVVVIVGWKHLPGFWQGFFTGLFAAIAVSELWGWLGRRQGKGHE